MNFVEYVVEKRGLEKVVYFVASREEGDGWIAGFFPAYMAPNPGDETDEEIFDMANPDHTVTGPTKQAAEDALRAWIEQHYTVHDRRTERRPLKG